MQVEASVDEADIGEVRVDQDVRFTVDSYPDDTFLAKVGQIRQSATQGSGAVSYLVILDVDNPEGKLLTGMTANVDIITGRKAGALRIPVASLRFLPREGDRAEGDSGEPGEDAEIDKRTVIWLAGDDPYAPRRHAIETGLVGEDYVEVTGGLEPGTPVLVRSREKSEDERG